MKIMYLRSGPLKVNSYFLIDENSNSAILIDGGENYKLIKKTEQELGVNIVAEFLTHAHFDHAGNAKKLQDDGVKIYISKTDAKKLNPEGSLSTDFGRSFESFIPDYTFEDGEEFEICGIKIKAVITKGHTDGSATFIVKNNLFTGDTLFLECVGRTDFKTGNKDEMIAFVKKLFALNGDYNVFPGHDDFTTLEHEKKYNLFRDY